MARVTLTNLVKAYGAHVAVKGINLDIADKSFVALVGPSGCGKSTTLRMIAGLETVSWGEISIAGKVVNEVSSRSRGVAMVFQSYALYPHMSVRSNLSFGLRIARVAKAEVDRRVAVATEILELGPYMERRPSQLSGGQRQRVAMGRAIVREPQVFLFDEPLSNLDAKLRHQMRVEIKKLHRRLQNTVIYVTHDQVEAMTLADQIVVLDKGAIQQVGTPMELYQSPANLFVAQFIGSPKMNVLAVRPNGTALIFADGSRVDFGVSVPPSLAHVGFRPEEVQLLPGGQGQLQGKVEVVERLGSDTFAHIGLRELGTITVRMPGNVLSISSGQSVGLGLAMNQLHQFSVDGIRLP